jgi:hypothetical protein
MIYLGVTLALSFICAAGTWMAYRLFLRFVGVFDRRAVRRWRAEEEAARAETFAAPPDEDDWPEIILTGEDEEYFDRAAEIKRKRPEK